MARRGTKTAARSARASAEPRTIDRRTVLDVASRILADEGPTALTMRRLATDVGASTMVLYSRFGSREALLEELLAEGFRRFADELGRVHDDDPWRHLAELGRAYRRFGLTNRTYYRLLWDERPMPPDCPPETETPAALHGRRAFGALVLAVTRVLAALDRPAREAEPLALGIWSTVHGFVSLELAGVMRAGDADAAYERTLAFTAAGLRGS